MEDDKAENDDEMYFFSSDEDDDRAVSASKGPRNKTVFATSAATIGEDPQLLLGLVMLSYAPSTQCDEVLLYTRDKRILFRGVIDTKFSITVSKASASIRASNCAKSYILQLPSDDNCILFAATVLRSINRCSKQRSYVDVVVGQGDQDVGVGSSILCEICNFDETASGTLKWQGGFIGMKVRGKRIIASGQMVMLVTVRRLKIAKTKGKNKDRANTFNVGATPVHDLSAMSNSMSASDSQGTDAAYDTVEESKPDIPKADSYLSLQEDEVMSPLPISAPPCSVPPASTSLDATLTGLLQEVSNINASVTSLCNSLPKDISNLNKRLDEIFESLGSLSNSAPVGSASKTMEPASAPVESSEPTQQSP
uniref:C2 NT-type domain-containing protein n=1 Tax=Syphacia muris TaxID=451379 RepID=A0A0N5AN44_9BILA